MNLLLASHPDSALVGYYPTHGGLRPVDAQLFLAFSAFCAENRGELVRLLRDGSTQTNEIRRCVALRVGLAHVQRRWPGPLALVEAGASAGLNLLFDRYRYRVGGDEPSPAASQVVIGCELRGSAPAGQVLGDAVTDTARLLSGLPGNEPVVVFTASLLSYLELGGRAAFAGQLRQAADRRPVAWVFAEAPGLAATMNLSAPALAGPLAQRTRSIWSAPACAARAKAPTTPCSPWPIRTCAGSLPPAPARRLRVGRLAEPRPATARWLS